MAKERFASAVPLQPTAQTGRSIRTVNTATSYPALDKRVIWLTLGIGAVLRLATLGVQSLWLDEGVSFWTVNRNLPALVDQLSNGFRPLFFWLLYPFSLLGTSEWLLRLPSALAGIASLGLIYMLGRELFDPTTGLLAMALLAFSPLHLWYSQEARFYALIGFLSLGAVYFAVRGLKYNRLFDWILFGMFEGLGLWTETGAFWYILAINLSALLLIRYLLSQRRIFGWALAQMVGVTLYLPRVVKFASAVQGSHTSWIPPATVRVLLRVMSDFSGGFMHSALFGILSMLGVALSIALGLRWLLHEAPHRWLAYAVLLPWMAVPITTSFILSQPYYRPQIMQAVFGDRPSIFLTRNLVTILFPLLLVLARSLVLLYRQTRPAWRWLSLGLTAGLLALYAIGYFSNHLVLRKTDYRSAARLVAENAAPGDLVLTSPGYIEQPTAYYYYEKKPLRDLSLESVRDGVVDSRTARLNTTLLGKVEQDPYGLIQQHDRVWLITNDNVVQKPDPDLINYLEQQARLVQTQQFEGTLLRLYVLPQRKMGSP